MLPVEGDDQTVQQCICSYSRALKAHLGPEIAVAPLIRESPLFQAGPPGEPARKDRTQENLFLKGYWRDLLSHFKWALGCKGPMFRFRMVTDEKLKVVWLGAESYATRAKTKRDDVVTFNSLADLVGPEIDLVILRLGFLGYKNVAMPGVLKEALMIREFACKPTWIVEVPTSIYQPGHFSYSEDVDDYIKEHFEIVNLTRHESARSDEVQHGVAGAPIPEDEDGSVGLGADSPPPAAMRHPMPEERPRRAPVAPPPDAIELPGADRPTKWKPSKKKGGGPA